MIAFVVLALAALVGVLLATLDGPHDRARTERFSELIIVAGAVTTAAGVAVAVVT